MPSMKTSSLEAFLTLKESDGETAPVRPAPRRDLDGATASRRAAVKTPISMRVDPDILKFFRDQGDGHLIRMHQVLRDFVDAKKGQDER